MWNNFQVDVLVKCDYLGAYQAQEFFTTTSIDHTIDSFITTTQITSTGWSDSCGTSFAFETRNWLQYTDDRGEFHMIRIPRD